jgi:hypothetical protein
MPFAEVIARRTFAEAPAPGVCLHAVSNYTSREAPVLESLVLESSRSDTQDAGRRALSTDNGRTWSAPETVPTGAEVDGGTWRAHPRGGWLDPGSGRYLRLRTEGVLPTDHPLEGLRHWHLVYAVSEDGGRTERLRESVVAGGEEFDETHPLPGVVIGRNGFMLGDFGCRPLALPDGTILLPCQISPAGPDGTFHNPGGGYTFHDSAVLAATWRADGGLAWELRGLVKGDPEVSTRGFLEPTLGALSDGRLLMVMRASNDARPELPAHRWASLSADQGATWTAPAPWTWDDGAAPYSPSSMSQLLEHSSGRLLWIGNLTPQIPRGNWPRYPLVLVEVDRRSGRLRRATMTVLDDRREDEPEKLTLSNFFVREDRPTGNLVVHLSRPFSRWNDACNKPDRTADAGVLHVRLG